MADAIKIELKGYEKTLSKFNKLEKGQKTIVGKSAMKGATEILKQAKANAPVDNNNMKPRMKLVPFKKERGMQKHFYVGYKDYQTLKSLSGSGGFYPQSQESGWFARNGRFIPGYHFQENAFEQQKNNGAKKTMNTFKEEVYKAWEKAGG